MLKLYDNGIYLVNGETICSCPEEVAQKTGRIVDAKEAEKGTMAYGILQAHNKSGDPDQLQLKFDSMTSHDITYVGIIQTARASGMKQFPLPYVLTNCHNSLCAVGGTINEDDHQFALSAAHKYGGIYVPPNMAVIHSYNREMMSGCGRMILGSDSHTRYGALGTMAVGEGGGELAKQLVGEWHLVSWNGAAPGVFDAYVSFASDKTFEIYQQIEQVGYQKYTGSYLIGNKMLSGKYSDNTPWGSSYEVSFDESGNTLTLVSDPSVGEVSVYTRASIPASVKGGATVMKASSRAAGPLLF